MVTPSPIKNQLRESCLAATLAAAGYHRQHPCTLRHYWRAHGRNSEKL